MERNHDDVKPSRLSAKIYVKLILIKSILSFVQDSFYFLVDFYFCLSISTKTVQEISFKNV